MECVLLIEVVQAVFLGQLSMLPYVGAGEILGVLRKNGKAHLGCPR